MKIGVTGLNHRTAPVAVREKLYYSHDEAAEFMRGFEGCRDGVEVVLLSTCNRTELYFAVQDGAGMTLEEAAMMVSDSLIAGKSAEVSCREVFFEKTGIDAVRHIMRVASGADSLLRGEDQILGQLKSAYRDGCAAGACGTYLHKLFHAAFRTGKRVRNETDIRRDVFSAIEPHIIGHIGSYEGKTVLVIGAGEIASLAAVHAHANRPARVCIANRTLEKAESLASCVNGDIIGLDSAGDVLRDADVVMVATSCAGFVLSCEDVRRAMAWRPMRPMLIVDLSIPRNVAPSAGDNAGVTLINMDTFASVAAESVERLDAAESIICTDSDAFAAWYDSRQSVSAIREVYEHVEDIRCSELARCAELFTDEQRRVLDGITRSIVKKIMHIPVSNLTSRCDDPDVNTIERIEAFRKVFNID